MGNLSKNSFMRAFALVLAIAIAFPPQLFAGEVGRVTYVEGRADVLKDGQEASTPLRESDVVSVGDAIRTKSNSKVEVTFFDASVMRVAQNSRVSIKEYELDSLKNRTTATIDLERGKARTIIAKTKDHSPFNINTPNAKGTVRGSDVFAYYQAGSSGMLVAEGQLTIANAAQPGKTIIVPAGSSVIIPLEELPKAPRKFLDVERKFQEEDTSIPAPSARPQGGTVMKGVIAKLSGEVKVTPKGGTPRAATVNDVLSQGDRIETGEDGIVEIRLENGNVINLKQRTDLTIVILTNDPSSGEYQNQFESSEGKIRARIEGLKGKSSFTVKTPAAISGARGTIMYLDIQQTVTKAFFEGGTGFLSNTASGLEKSVQPGTNAYADGTGFVSNPVATSDGERIDWGDGWDPGNGTEGYSSPSGGGMLLSSDDSGALTVVGSVPEGVEEGSTSYDTVWAFEETEPPVTPEDEGPTVVPDNNFYSTGAHYGEENVAMNGLAAVAGSLWSEEPATFISGGLFSITQENEDGGFDEPFVWHTAEEMIENEDGSTVIDPNKNHVYSNNPTNNVRMTADGGAYYGLAGGRGGSGILEGFASFLYVDPSGNAGVAGGSLAGAYGGGAFLLMGDDLLSDGIYAEGIDISPGDLYNSIWLTGRDESGSLFGKGELGGAFLTGSFPEGGTLSATIGGVTASIVNNASGVAEAWGIFGATFDGTYQGATSPLEPGSVMIGGEGLFGAYYSSGSEDYEGGSSEFRDDYGYWAATVDGSADSQWDANGILFDMSGYYITQTRMGTLYGRVIGTYADPLTEYGEGEWQAVGVGSYSGAALSLSGQIEGEGEDSCLYYNGAGYLERVGYDWGYLGSTSSAWWSLEQAPVLAVGGFFVDSEEDTYLQSSDFNGSNNANYDYGISADGSAFHGFLAGLWNDGEILSSSAGIYIDPQGRAGLIFGTLSGEYDIEAGLWFTRGVFAVDPLVRAGTFYPDDLYDEFDWESLSAEVNGEWPDSDYELYGESQWGETLSLDGQSWGIYRLTYGDDEGYYYNPDHSAVWTSDVYGEGWFGSTESIGIMKGDVYGSYDDYWDDDEGTWSAASVGTWKARETYSDDAESEGQFYGVMGGVWNAGVMIGKSIAIYVQSYYGELGQSALSSDLWAGGFDAGGDIFADAASFGGMMLGLPYSNWGIWALKTGGTYDDPVSGRYLMYLGGAIEDMYGDFDYTLGNGLWFAISTGIAAPDGGLLSGIVRGFVFFYSEGDSYVGLLKGETLGVAARNVWEMVGLGEWDSHDYTESSFEDTSDLYESLDYTYFTGSGSGRFEDIGVSGALTANTISGQTFNISDQEWGIWFATFDGTYEGNGSAFSFAYGCMPVSDDMPIYILGWVNGSKALDKMNGAVRGIWLSPSDGSETVFVAGGLDGDFLGYTAEDGTWQGVGAGDYDNDTCELRPGFTASYLADFVSTPIELDHHVRFAVGRSDFYDVESESSAAILLDNFEFGFLSKAGEHDRGIWIGGGDGYDRDPIPSDWSVMIAGGTATDSIIIGRFAAIEGGETEDGDQGTFRGFYFAPTGNGAITAGTFDGAMAVRGRSGDGDRDVWVDGEEFSGEFGAVGAGQWVEVTDLLTPDQLGFDLETLQDFVSIPVTEVYSSTLVGANSFLSNTVLDISVSQNDYGRFWFGNIAGDVIAQPTDIAANPLTVANGNDVMILNWTQWQDNQWSATVGSGSVIDGAAVSGQFAGVYSDSAFNGVGLGQVEPQPE